MGRCIKAGVAKLPDRPFIYAMLATMGAITLC